ncbi:hypothetical protein [Massilia sp. Se16.2.3]|uniref:hypothetical protein n=1 Tax=Massilia sp. Se16.2.3 TaxID=2709303 RepID=UPI001601E830|nr:hypothetical protein [Massilia sp. Se16.2.3]QNB00896.1 hypothetical protein G4G31_22205 [Massilia sp. Se16.2.3]
MSSEVFAGADLSLGIRNATDQRYADPAGPAFVQEAVAREGRTLHARLSYQF